MRDQRAAVGGARIAQGGETSILTELRVAMALNSEQVGRAGAQIAKRMGRRRAARAGARESCADFRAGVWDFNPKPE